MSKVWCVVEDNLPVNTLLRFEHGVSFWIETLNGIVLFDTGPSAALLTHNLSVLGLDVSNLDALALSHAHYDHTGGLGVVLPSQKDLPIFALTDIFQARYSFKNGDYQSVGFYYQDEQLVRQANLKLNDLPMQILPGLWTSGEIKERPEPVGGSKHHFIRKDSGWVNDPYQDDMSLVLEIAEGLVLICGCCHAGLLNTMMHVERVFQQTIHTVIGGTHLISSDDRQLEHVVYLLGGRYPNLRLFLNHCTGEKAINKLKDAFGDRVKRFNAGSVLEFNDQFTAD